MMSSAFLCTVVRRSPSRALPAHPLRGKILLKIVNYLRTLASANENVDGVHLMHVEIALLHVGSLLLAWILNDLLLAICVYSLIGNI